MWRRDISSRNVGIRKSGPHAAEKSKSGVNVASTASTPAAESESFLFSITKPNTGSEDSVIIENVPAEKRSTDY